MRSLRLVILGAFLEDKSNEIVNFVLEKFEIYSKDFKLTGKNLKF